MENSDARDENDANGQKICDGSLDSEPAEPASRYRHPDEIGEGWRPCRDFLDPLADELEDWLHVSEAEGLDYGAEPSTLDSLMCILGGVMIVGGGGAQSAAWSRARAWFDVHGPAGFGDRFTSRVQAVWDEYESFDRQFGDHPPDSDSSDDDDSSYEKASFEFQGFLVTVVEPFLADLRNWSIELQKLLPPAVPDRPLGERDQLVLTVLRNEKALDSDHRMRTEDIASKAIGPAADANQFKEVIAKLKRLKYVDTKEGRRGGCWLTVSGRERAEKL